MSEEELDQPGDSLLESVEMEGQEAVLVEEEGSVEDDVAAANARAASKKKSAKRLSLFRKSKSAESNDEEVPKSSVIKTAKSRVVLIDDSVNQAAAHKAKQSRLLLETALRPFEHTNRDIHEDQREQMIRAAFQFAAEARRLFQGEEKEDVETIISLNTRRGETAAAKAWAIMSARKPPTNLSTGESDDAKRRKGSTSGEQSSSENRHGSSAELSKEEWPTRYTPQDIFDEAEKHATLARRHLDSILPNFGQQQRAVPTAGIVTDELDNFTLSTLGFDNTFQETTLSLTSLNEILDGPLSPQESKVEASQPKQAAETETNKKDALDNDDDKQGNNDPKDPSFEQEDPGIKRLSDEARAAPLAEEDKPVEQFIATIVESEDEQSLPSDVSHNSELERLKAVEHRTDSRLKEAMEADETGSLTSWDGVALFRPRASDSPPKKKGGGSSENRQKTVSDALPKLSKKIKPQFVTAADFDPDLLMSNQVLPNEAEEPDILNQEPDSSPKRKKKRGLFGWARRRNTRESRELQDGAEEKEDLDENEENSTPDSALPSTSDDDRDAIVDTDAPSTQSEEGTGDKSTSDSVDSNPNQQTTNNGLQGENPTADDVDMMPDKPDPSDVRCVTSLDADQVPYSDSDDDVKFADVEIGTEQVEKKILSRDTVIEKINMPRKVKEPSDAGPLERVRTLPNQDGISQIEPSTTMMDEIEEKRKMAKSKEVDKEAKRGRRWWHVFSSARRKEEKPEDKESVAPTTKSVETHVEESNVPSMSLVSSANTGSSLE